MTTPTPRPHPGQHGHRQGMPLPGSHLPGAAPEPEPADPALVRAEVRELLAELEAGAGHADAGVDLIRRAKILEQAHDVLVEALATVDKI
ncbi:hypothetical protein [Nocardia asteroides]|uniref:hypothetical protein n=1 Tax=Nocardia asteroides TaxID=1824 RepID=UPI001E37C0ED|nr:hypothetical protein [Nocardia asteroides]UGT60908.1 hypothetical protein LTT61_27815 [Nocardia asteroides]